MRRRRHQEDWPDWWEWELEFTGHLLRRMVDRGLDEVQLRAMMASASGYVRDVEPGRWVIMTRHDRRDWEVIVEPDDASGRLVVVTAFPLS